MSCRRLQRVSVWALGALLLIAVTGCPTPTPPEAVLKGTWELNGNLVNPDLTSLLITFDRKGQITEIDYVYNNLTITIDAGSLVRSSSDVDGSDVSISASWSTGSTLFFEGTLNEAQTRIDGVTAYQLEIGPAITIIAPTGPATLIRQ